MYDLRPCKGYNYSCCLYCFRESKVPRPDSIELGTDFIKPTIYTLTDNEVVCNDYVDDDVFIGFLSSCIDE